MDEITIENAKKFHLLMDTLQSNPSTNTYFQNLKRIWKFICKELKHDLQYPTTCNYENSNIILVWSNSQDYSELEINESGFVSMLFQIKNGSTLYETDSQTYTLPTLQWVNFMRSMSS